MIRKYQKQVKDSLTTSLVVGTLLIFINHSKAIFDNTFTSEDLVHWSLNYVVPFFVSLYSRIAALRKVKEPRKTIDA